MTSIKIEDFKIKTDKPYLNILQITDMHYHHYGWTDKKEMLGIRDMSRKFDVDFIVNTGDMFGNRSSRTIKKIMGAFDKYVGAEFPWTFAWGNHDNEIFTKGKFKDGDFFSAYDEVEQFLEDLPHCIYKKTRNFIENYDNDNHTETKEECEAFYDIIRGEKESKRFDGFYGGNFGIEVINAKNQLAWTLFIMNSRRNYHIPPNALDWMEDSIRKNEYKIPALVFYHVPNNEFNIIWDNELAKGIKRERVCNELDQGRVHKRFKEMKVIKGCFVGHDHVNDYHGELDGITYSYGRKSGKHGYGSYEEEPGLLPEGRKAIKIGGTLIKISLNSKTALDNNWEFISIFEDGTTWKPDKMITW